MYSEKHVLTITAENWREHERYLCWAFSTGEAKAPHYTRKHEPPASLCDTAHYVLSGHDVDLPAEFRQGYSGLWYIVISDESFASMEASGLPSSSEMAVPASLGFWFAGRRSFIRDVEAGRCFGMINNQGAEL